MWYEPEDLGPEQDARDEAYGRTEFWVYVLTTDYGHYVGHTSNPWDRLPRHYGDEVESTAGGNADLAWITELSLRTREDATRYEAALKSWRDSESVEFTEHTGLVPVPWRGWTARVEKETAGERWKRRVERTGRRRERERGRGILLEDVGYFLLGCLLLVVAGVVLIVIVGWIWQGLVGPAG